MATNIGYCTQNQRCTSTLRLMRETTYQGLRQSSNGCATVRSRANLFATLLSNPCAQETVNPNYLLAWIPESLLDERGQSEWDKFVSVEGKAPYDEEEGQFDRTNFRTALIAFDVARCCPYRHADFASRDIRLLRAVDLRVLLTCLPPELVFLV